MAIPQFEQIYLSDAKTWRKWLEANHENLNGVWLIYYKKHTKKPRVPYNEAVEEALCFGWIDSIVKRIDDEQYMQKFTPRKPKSTWSDDNKRRIEKLGKQGKMTEKGMKAVEVAKQNGMWDKVVDAKMNYEFSDELLHLLKSNEAVFFNYSKLAPSHQKNYKTWVMSAKKPETQLKRLNEMMHLLERDQKMGMK